MRRCRKMSKAARDQLDGRLEAVVNVMRGRNTALAEQKLTEVEKTIAVIEQFLAK